MIGTAPKDDKKVLSKIHKLVEQMSSEIVHERKLENVTCKKGRKLEAKKDKFWDVVDANYPTFK